MHRKKLCFPNWSIIGKYGVLDTNLGPLLEYNRDPNKNPMTFQQYYGEQLQELPILECHWYFNGIYAI